MGQRIEISCEVCEKKFMRQIGEINRSAKVGRGSFCSRTCAAISNNAPKRAKEIVKTCPFCGVRFASSTHNKAASFCSKSCAAKCSETQARNDARRRNGLLGNGLANLISTAEMLKRREAWKYELLKPLLLGRDYEFEFQLGDYVFDLALKDTKVLVEFDGHYHSVPAQQEADGVKAATAEAAGFKVIRRFTETARVIAPSTINGL